MVPRNKSILVIAGIVTACIVIFLWISQCLPGPGPARAGAIPPADSAGDQKAPLSGNLSLFTSEAEVRAFLTSHTDPTGNYPDLSASDTLPSGTPATVTENGTRIWSFAVDTSTFRPDEYIVVATAVTEDTSCTALFNVLERNGRGLARQAVPVTVSGGSGTSGAGYFITIDPVGDRFIGEKFSVTGMTSLPADAEILVEVYSSSFKPTQKSQSGEFSGSAGTIRVSGSSPAGSGTGTASAAGPEFSGTNVQVGGVDEADIVKTDGKYIYAVTGNSLNILQAYPAGAAKIVSTQKFTGTPVSLYISGDRLVVISSDEKPADTWSCTAGSCRDYSLPAPKTLFFVYSVSDPARPVLLRQIEIDGRYADSRLIGTYLYFVASRAADIYAAEGTFPRLIDTDFGTSVLPMYYFDEKDKAFSETTVGAVDLVSDNPVNAQAFLVGSAGTVYVSPQRLYFAIASFGDETNGDSTAIYAFTIRKDRISYAAQGIVGGTLLNQFSMDEYGGNLRAATTVQEYSRRWGTTRYSRVTVLDENLDTAGIADGIALGERIYAARFIGNRLYLVTFRETDPFYVIDLSDPQKPAMLGELKIPGFSNYLHPYDETHLIGIGKESAQGSLKMALFDVTDVARPRLIGEELVGGDGSDSEVLRDHRAFLFDKEKDLLVLPVSLVIDAAYRPDRPYGAQQTTVWGGAYVYGVDASNGFTLKGTVKHSDSTYGTYSPVLRSLYIGDTLYTMSGDTIVMSDLGNDVGRIGSVGLP